MRFVSSCISNLLGGDKIAAHIARAKLINPGPAQCDIFKNRLIVLSVEVILKFDI